MDSGGSSDMTLAFELTALKQLADPTAVFNDVRQWTSYVGVVSDEPTYAVTNFTRKRRIRQDFFSGPRDKRESLENIKRQFDSERHVLIGVDEADEELAADLDWEYLPLEEAAEAAGWELGEADDGEEDLFEDEGRDDWP